MSGGQVKNSMLVHFSLTRTSYLVTGQVKILMYLPGGQVKIFRFFYPWFRIFLTNVYMSNKCAYVKEKNPSQLAEFKINCYIHLVLDYEQNCIIFKKYYHYDRLRKKLSILIL